MQNPVILVACVISAVAVAQDVVAQDRPGLSPDQIRLAVVEGIGLKGGGGTVVGNDSWDDFVIALRGPYGRVMAVAGEATVKYQAFSVADVPAEITAPYLEVVAYPGKPSLSKQSGWRITPAATHLVIRAKGTMSAIQPKKLDTFPFEWANALGAKFSSQGVNAQFDLTNLPASGDLEVIVIAGNREFKYTVKEEDRRRLR